MYLGVDFGRGNFVKIENSGVCCEQWGMLFDGVADDDEMLSLPHDEVMIVIDMKLNIAREKQLKSAGSHENWVCVDAEYCGFTGVERTFTIDAWCDHNGYYSHTVFLKFGEWEEEFEI